MPPRRRDDDAGGGGGGGGGAQQQQHVQAVHRLAFVQHLMRHGCLPEDDAKEAFRRLTGFTDGEAGQKRGADRSAQTGWAIAMCALMCERAAPRRESAAATHTRACSCTGSRCRRSPHARQSAQWAHAAHCATGTDPSPKPPAPTTTNHHDIATAKHHHLKQHNPIQKPILT